MKDLNVLSHVACCPYCGHPLWTRVSQKKNLVLICPKSNCHVPIEKAKIREIMGHKNIEK